MTAKQKEINPYKQPLHKELDFNQKERLAAKKLMINLHPHIPLPHLPHRKN